MTKHWFAAGLALFAVGFTVDPARAQSGPPLCKEAEAGVAADPNLAAAVKAAYGDAAFSGATPESCLYPLKLLRYDTADVLLTLPAVPGSGCHGCGGRLSALVFARKKDTLKLVKTFADFSETGSFGSPGEVTQIEIAGDDGLAIEHGGTFQGYTYTAADFYVFRKGGVVHMKARPQLCLVISNSGAVTDPAKVYEVQGRWRQEPSADTGIVTEYVISDGGKTGRYRAVWTFEGDALVHRGGDLPRRLGGETCI
jgi:hypothetical protein